MKFSLLAAVVQATPGYIPPRMQPHVPVTIGPITIHRSIVPVVGNWHNCQPIRISESISMDDRFYEGELPEIWFDHSSVCSYQLVGPAGADHFFSLKNIDGQNAQGRKSAQILLNNFLDRETTNLHELEVSAYNCDGDPIATYTIQIIVADVNDHVPWLNPESLQMTYCPGMQPGTVIGQLAGSDIDIGAYGHTEFFFTHRKPFGNPVLVNYFDGTSEEIKNIFRLDSDGELSVSASDPRINFRVRTLSIEVGVRDHPGNPIYGSRTAQLLIRICNQPPIVTSCDLGIISENSLDVPKESNITIVDFDADGTNGIVDIVVNNKKDEGAVEIVTTNIQDGGTWVTKGSVKITRTFNYEFDLSGAAIKEVNGEHYRVAQIPVSIRNPHAKDEKTVDAVCTLLVKNEKEVSIRKTDNLRINANCPFYVGEDVGKHWEIEVSLENQNHGVILYSANDPFFEVSTNDEKKQPSIVYKKMLGSEADCLLDPKRSDPSDSRRYYWLTINATPQADSTKAIDMTLKIECIDLNDQEPHLILSATNRNSICRETSENFDDKDFLTREGYPNVDVARSPNINFVAIAIVGGKRNSGKYTFSISEDNDYDGPHREDFRFTETSDPNVFYLGYVGNYNLDSLEAIKFSVHSSEAAEKCGTDRRWYTLIACSCHQDENYPAEQCQGGGAAFIWIWLLLLLLLLAALLGCCYYYFCIGAPVVGGKDTQYVYKYDKPDWYYYLYNLMGVKDTDRYVADNAQVDHPEDVGGVLVKSKEEVDRINNTYDEKKIFNESIQTNNRVSVAISGISDLTGLTGTVVNPPGPVVWGTMLKGVPEMRHVAFGNDRSNSPISNITDITINENRISALREHKLVGLTGDELWRTSTTFNHIDDGVENRSTLSRNELSRNLRPSSPIVFGNRETLDKYHRAMSPTSMMRNTGNSFAENRNLNTSTESENSEILRITKVPTHV